jgi:hypothetical protein
VKVISKGIDYTPTVVAYVEIWLSLKQLKHMAPMAMMSQ